VSEHPARTTRSWRAVGLGLVLAPFFALVLAGPVRAQTTSTTIDENADATDQPTSTDAVAGTPTTEPATTTTTAPPHCDPVPPVAAVFVGRVTVRDEIKAHMSVLTVKQGNVAREVDVEYQDDSRFLKAGQLYLVTAAADPETQLLVSKVKTPRGLDVRCVAADPIYTRLADGAKVPTGIFSGMKGKWKQVPLAFAKPLTAVVAFFVALVALKHLVLIVYRFILRRSGHAPRPSPEPGR
jgi:hypothetical protein